MRGYLYSGLHNKNTKEVFLPATDSVYMEFLRRKGNKQTALRSSLGSYIAPLTDHWHQVADCWRRYHNFNFILRRATRL